jgi:hypothetical protein
MPMYSFVGLLKTINIISQKNKMPMKMKSWVFTVTSKSTLLHYPKQSGTKKNEKHRH